MSEEFIKIEVHDQETQRLFAELYKNMDDMSPVMKIIGEIIKTSVKKNFEVSGRYSEIGSWKGGTKSWQPLRFQSLF
ncbi:hypothetical protein HZA55_06305 [Candidatus Poribacteria bacterium]|nr:hypothetical protein [Candidatus Poribacteria bacterium]